jgi:hypothetical protein
MVSRLRIMEIAPVVFSFRETLAPVRRESGPALSELMGPGADSRCSMDLDTASTKELDRLFDARKSGPLSGKS